MATVVAAASHKNSRRLTPTNGSPVGIDLKPVIFAEKSIRKSFSIRQNIVRAGSIFNRDFSACRLLASSLPKNALSLRECCDRLPLVEPERQFGAGASETPLHWPRWFTRTAACAVFLLGAVALTGWTFDLSVLKSGLPGLPIMVPNTAAGFVLAGFSLWLLARTPAHPLKTGLAKVAAAIIALIGALTLGESLWGWHIPLDRLLFPSRTLALGGNIPGRPSILTAGAFLCYGTAMLLVDSKPRTKSWVLDLLIVIPVLVSLLALIGYACGVPAFYGWRSLVPNTVMALSTAVALIVLGSGILSSRPNRGLMILLRSSTAGGQVARRLLL